MDRRTLSELIYKQKIRTKDKPSRIGIQNNQILKFRRLIATEKSEFRELSVIVKLQMNANACKRPARIKVSM